MKKSPLASACFMLLVWVGGASAWHDEGHLYVALAAVEALPPEVPAFFRDGAGVIAHLAIDPDVHRNEATPQLTDTSAPDHFIDLEYLEGLDLPATRSAFVALCHDRQLDPQRVGFLPYVILEQAQRMAIAFAEHRADPASEPVRIKCLVYAGLLSHYTADLHMPLHTTVHHNGLCPRNPDGSWGSPPRSNLHAVVDALPTWLTYRTLLGDPIPIEPIDGEWMPFVCRNLAQSHALVAQVYALQPRLDDARAAVLDEQVRAFTIDRQRAAARFTGEIFLHAWRRSATITLASWLDRDTLDNHLDRDAVPPQPSR